MALLFCLEGHRTLVADDATFNAGSGANGVVRALAVQPDDAVLIGGNFTSFNGQPRAGIARTLADGQLDEGFVVSTGLVSSVSCVAVLPDGRIVLGSTNAGPGGAYVVRVNHDGSTDESFVTSVNGPVHAMALGTNGSIWLGGDFTEVNGLARNRLVRLDEAGAVDAGFDAGAGPNGNIFALLPMSDGAVIVGGQFTTFAGLERGCVAKVQADGVVETNFNPRVGYSYYTYRYESFHLVRCLSQQVDGRIVVGGRFFAPAAALYPGTNGALSRLFADGRVDPDFNGVGGPQLQEVHAMAIESNGRIAVGGSFQGHDSVKRPYLLRVDSAGNLDDCLVASTNEAPNGTVFAIGQQSGDKLVVGGAFTRVASSARGGIARFQGGEPPQELPEVTLNPVFGWPRAQPGQTTWVDAIIKNCNGRLGIQWYRDGAPMLGMTSSRLSVGHYPYPSPGNYFAVVSNAVGVTTSSVVHVDFGGVNAEFNTTNGPSRWTESPVLSSVLSVLPSSSGQVLVGGRFTQVEGREWAHLARLNGNGSLDLTFTARPSRPVYSMIEQPDGRILIGGEFNAVNGQFRDRVARLEADGRLDTNFLTRLGLNGTVHSMALQPDGRVIVGGVFSIPLPGGGYMHHLARLETNGAVDFSFNAGTNLYAANTVLQFVRCLQLLPDGKILVGGGFNRAAGSARDYLARFLPDGTLDASYGVVPLPGPGGPIFSMAEAPGGLIYVGGAFTNFNGVAMTNLARLLPDGTWDETFRVQPVPSGDGWMINALAVDAGGRVTTVRSWYSSYDNSYHSSTIFRYDANGRLETNYVSPILVRGSDPSSGIACIALMGDGGAYIGGTFDAVDSVPARRVALLLPDLPRPPEFVSNPRSQTIEGGQGFMLSATAALSAPTVFQWFQNGEPLLMETNVFLSRTEVDPLMAGDYWLVASNVFGVRTSAVATVTVRAAGRPGSVVREFQATPGPSGGGVIALAESSNGKVFVGGSFSNYHGISRMGTAIIETDGSVNLCFAPQETALTWGYTSALLPLANGSVVVAGHPSLNGYRVRRYQTNGASDPDWKFNASLNPYAPIRASHGSRYMVSDLAADAQGRIYIGGGFSGVRVGGGSILPIRYTMRVFQDGTADTSYQVRLPSPDYAEAILAMCLDGEGNVLLGTHPGDNLFGMYRLNSQGRDDGTPRQYSSIPSDVWSMQSDAQGGTLFTCDAWSVGTNFPYGLGRRLPSGQFDPSFSASPLPSQHYYGRVLGVQCDGKILATVVNSASSFPVNYLPWRTSIPNNFYYGEWFSTNRLVRLNPDGSLDGSFDIGDGPNGYISSALIRSDGNILVGGSFSRFSGHYCNNIALLHGGLPQPPSVSQPAESKTVVAGDALHLSALVEGFPPPQLQWLRNGVVIPGATQQAFRLRSAGWDDSGIYSLVASNASGISTSIVATVSVQAGRLNADWVDSGFSTETEPNGEVHVIVPQPDGRILIGGQFTRVSSVPRPGIARLLADGWLDVSFAPSPDFTNLSVDGRITVSHIVVMPDGKVAASRTFTQFNNSLQSDMVRLHEDGRLDTAFTNRNYVIPLLAMPDGRLLAGRGVPSLLMLASDGTVDDSFVAATNLGGSISRASLLVNGRILVSAEGGGTIERLMPDGSRDGSFDRSELSLNSGSSSDICFPSAGGAIPSPQLLAQAVQPDGKILVGGVFSKSLNRYTANLLRLLPSGRFDPGFSAWTESDYAIRAIAVQPDGKILIGGCFTNVGAYPTRTSRLHLARLHPDGSLDASFNPAPTLRGTGSGYVRTMALQPDGRVLIGGVFDSVNGATRRNLARLNGDLVMFQTVSGGGEFSTKVATVAGRSYFLETRSTFDGGAWEVVDSALGTGVPVTLECSSHGGDTRYYRIRVE